MSISNLKLRLINHWIWIWILTCFSSPFRLLVQLVSLVTKQYTLFARPYMWKHSIMVCLKKKKRRRTTFDMSHSTCCMIFGWSVQIEWLAINKSMNTLKHEFMNECVVEWDNKQRWADRLLNESIPGWWHLWWWKQVYCKEMKTSLSWRIWNVSQGVRFELEKPSWQVWMCGSLLSVYSTDIAFYLF